MACFHAIDYAIDYLRHCATLLLMATLLPLLSAVTLRHLFRPSLLLIARLYATHELVISDAFRHFA